MNEAVNASNPLWASTIKKIEIDLFKKKITFGLVVTDSGNVTNHVLEIPNFDTMLWVEPPKDPSHAYDFKKCDYYELTSITFGKYITKSDDKWLKYYPMGFNIAIEIWESAFLIKSNSLIIDGVEYPV